jgi:predicted amino acid racemase
VGVKGVGTELGIYGDKGVNDEEGFIFGREKDIISRGSGVKLRASSRGNITD